MKTLSLEAARAAWDFPLPHEDPVKDFDRRLESVQDAIKEANGDASGYWSLCRAKEKG